MKGKFSLRTCKCAQFAKLTLLSRGYPNASRGYPNASEINAKKVISVEGPHCLPFHLHLLTVLHVLHCKTKRVHF